MGDTEMTKTDREQHKGLMELVEQEAKTEFAGKGIQESEQKLGWRGKKPELHELKSAIKFNKDGSIRDGPIWTICEVLRQIWMLAEDAPNRDKIRLLATHAHVYAKRMDGKLRKGLAKTEHFYSREVFPEKTEKEKEHGL